MYMLEKTSMDLPAGLIGKRIEPLGTVASGFSKMDIIR
jgi:hypothetical protein